MSDLFWVLNFIKIRHNAILRPNLPKEFNFGSRSTISNIILIINKFDLLWKPNFIALGMYIIFRTNVSWNERTDTCFNVKCVLFGHNFNFLGGYLVVIVCYLVVTTAYLVVTAHYWWLLLVLLIATFSMNEFQAFISIAWKKLGRNSEIWIGSSIFDFISWNKKFFSFFKLRTLRVKRCLHFWSIIKMNYVTKFRLHFSQEKHIYLRACDLSSTFKNFWSVFLLKPQKLWKTVWQ